MSHFLPEAFASRTAVEGVRIGCSRGLLESLGCRSQRDRRSRKSGSNGRPALDQPDNEHDDRRHEKKVDQGSHMPDGEPEKPEDEKNDEDGPQHGLPPFIGPRERKVCAKSRVTGIALKNPSALSARLELERAGRLLLVDASAALADLLLLSRSEESETRLVPARALSRIKETFDAILLWREDRVGSRAVLEGTVRRLEPGGVLWIVTALRKVIGPKTPAVHRLELSDLTKGLERHGLSNDREVRITSWHVAYRFGSRQAEIGNR